MSNKNSDTFWSGDWLESQRQYMDALSTFSQFMANTVPGQEKRKNPMEDAMEAWWKVVAPSLPEGSNEFISRMAEQGKFFYILSEQFSRLLGNISELNKLSGDWQAALNAQFGELKKIFAAHQKDGKHILQGAWQLLPLDTLQRTFSSASVMPGDFLEDLKPETLQKVTDKFLSIPGVGYTREAQEQIQENIRLWNEYQKTSQEYSNAMSRVAINALDAMQSRIIAMAEKGEEINSLREIYDLWVDCSEAAYGDYVFTDEFSELYGRLTNTLMAVKCHGRNIVDEALGAFNMPTRRGMNTVQRRQQELRRSQKDTLKKIESLEEEITSLRKQVAGTRTGAAKKADAGKSASGIKKQKRKKSATTSGARKNSARRSSKNDNTIVIKI